MTILAYIPSPSQGVWYLGPLPIRAYALFIIVGIVVALMIGDRRWEARGGERGVIYDIALWAVPFGLVGGRLYHVITDWRTYFGDGGAGAAGALKIWDGGLGIWGAVALGAVGAWIACRRRGIPLPAFGDAVAPGIVLAQAIGRLGNYFNQELYGRETTLPWGLEIFYRRDPSGAIAVQSLNGVSTGEVAEVVHPTFLYELIWNVLVFVVLILIDRRFKVGHGRLFAMYVAGYCMGRFWVELLRSDFATTIEGIRINSFTSTLVFIGAAVYIVLAPKGREDPATLRGVKVDLTKSEAVEATDDLAATDSAPKSAGAAQSTQVVAGAAVAVGEAQSPSSGEATEVEPAPAGAAERDEAAKSELGEVSEVRPAEPDGVEVEAEVAEPEGSEADAGPGATAAAAAGSVATSGSRRRRWLRLRRAARATDEVAVVAPAEVATGKAESAVPDREVSTEEVEPLAEPVEEAVLTDGDVKDLVDQPEVVLAEGECEEPADAEAEDAEPGDAEAEGVEPGDAEAEGVEPADTEAEGVEPADAEAEGVEPADAEAEGVEPADAEAEDVEPADADADDVEPGGGEVEPAEVDAESDEFVAAEGEDVGPEDGRTEDVEPEGGQAEVAEPAETAGAAGPMGSRLGNRLRRLLGLKRVVGGADAEVKPEKAAPGNAEVVESQAQAVVDVGAAESNSGNAEFQGVSAAAAEGEAAEADSAQIVGAEGLVEDLEVGAEPPASAAANGEVEAEAELAEKVGTVDGQPTDSGIGIEESEGEGSGDESGALPKQID